MRTAAISGSREKNFHVKTLTTAIPLHGIVRCGVWSASTRRKRNDLMTALPLVFAHIRSNTLDIVVELRGKSSLDSKDLIVWIRNHFRLP
jgi:hypothetical protein